MLQIRCIHHDLFQKDDYVCYCFNGSRTHNSLLLVCHWGNWWELRDTAEVQFPVQAAGVLEASAHTRGTAERFGGKGAKYLGSFGNITLAGTVNTHASCLVHMAQQIRHTVSSAGVCSSAPTCLYGPGRHRGAIRAVREKCCFSTRHHLSQAVTREHPSNRCPRPQRFLYPAICSVQ